MPEIDTSSSSPSEEESKRTSHKHIINKIPS
jgi:hypothetical protein